MNREDARREVARLIGDAIFSQLSPEDIEEALNRSLTIDAELRWPGSPGYTETIDPYWAAAEAVSMLAIRSMGTSGGLEKFAAEGASFEIRGADLWGMTEALRAKSAIRQATSTGLGMLQIDVSTGYQPTSQGWPHGDRPDLDWT